jgi:4'-phosphopantetheinyl transferase
MHAPELRWLRTPLGPIARSRALGMLSVTERSSFDNSPEASRESFLAGRFLLRDLVGELTTTDPSAVNIEAHCPDCGGAHGRPVIAGTNLNVSLSRTKDIVVVAASWDAPIGIDIEVANTGAAGAVQAVTGEASVLHWTRVEAVLKADGRGLRVDPALVEFTDVDGALHGQVLDSADRYLITQADVAPDVLVSIAVRN